QRRIGQQRLREQHALALAAGEAPELRFPLAAEPDARERGFGLCSPLSREPEERRPPPLADERHEIVDGDRQRPIEVEELRHVADRPLVVIPLDRDRAGMRHLAEQAADQRRLAAAVRADDAVDAAGLDLEIDVVQDPRAAELEPDLAERDRRAAHDRQLPSATERMASTSVSRFSRISRSKRSAVYSPSDMCENAYIRRPVSFLIVSASLLVKYFSAKSTLTFAALIRSIVSASCRAVGSTPWRGSMTAPTRSPNSCIRYP